MRLKMMLWLLLPLVPVARLFRRTVVLIFKPWRLSVMVWASATRLSRSRPVVFLRASSSLFCSPAIFWSGAIILLCLGPWWVSGSLSIPFD